MVIFGMARSPQEKTLDYGTLEQARRAVSQLPPLPNRSTCGESSRLARTRHSWLMTEYSW